MKYAVLLCSALAFLVGCEKRPSAPAAHEVNDRNCQVEAIKRIEGQAAREAFAGRCARRAPSGGGIAPTQTLTNWLDLADPIGADKRGVGP